jgi:transaldolase
MTIPPGLLKQLMESSDFLPRVLSENDASSCTDAEIQGGNMSENTFRLLVNADLCTTTKIAEGLQAFIGDTVKLEEVIRRKIVLFRA